MPAVGWDIGGVNTKAARVDGGAVLSVVGRPYEIQRDPAALTPLLRQMAGDLGAPDAPLHAVTMTAELCDCFESKRVGVRAVLASVAQVACGRPVGVWTLYGRFVHLAAALEDPLPAAAANWLAAATLAGRIVANGFAVYLDVGSTTTDIVPISDGQPSPQGRTDAERFRL